MPDPASDIALDLDLGITVNLDPEIWCTPTLDGAPVLPRAICVTTGKVSEMKWHWNIEIQTDINGYVLQAGKHQMAYSLDHLTLRRGETFTLRGSLTNL